MENTARVARWQRPLRRTGARAAGKMVSGQIGVKDMAFFKNLWNDQSGASAAEYALILAIVGTGIAGAAWYLGDSVSTAMNTASDCIRTPGSVTGRTGC